MTLPEISRTMLKNSLLLGLFAAVTVTLVTLVQQGTAARIATAEREAKVQALAQILPSDSYDNHLLDSRREVFDKLLGNKQPSPAYLATLKGQASAVILQATAPDGYGGSIFLLIGIRADGHLAGVRAIGHKETPGLGDKIERAKSPWIGSFTGKSLQDPGETGWAVKKDGGQFDQFAGATITPRAVVKAVHQALQYFDAHQTELLAPIAGNRPLKNVGEAAKTRQKWPKKRSLRAVNEHFEAISNAVLATQVVFQRPGNDTENKHG